MSSDEELVAWLRLAILVRKAAAEAATPGPWKFEGDDPTDDELYSVHDGEHGDLIGQTVAWTRDRQVANGQHMALNDPQDTIARCEAELAILDRHRGEPSEWGGYRDDGTWQQRGPVCSTCGHDDGRLGVAWPCRTVRLLASGYRHQPGFPAAFAA